MDPLAGLREALNKGEDIELKSLKSSCARVVGDTIIWPDEGHGCPVEEGQVFELRSCSIEIARTHRRSVGKSLWFYIAWFTRYHSDPEVNLLGRTGGYIHDVNDFDKAMTAQDVETRDATLDVIAEEDRTDQHRNYGEPPEPEAVPSHEVGTYMGDRQAQANYEGEMRERRAALAELPIELRLANVRRLAEAKHIDISAQERVILKRLEALEREVLGEAA